MNKRSVCKVVIFLLVSGLFLITSVTAQQVRTLTYEDAIEIALNRSYTVKSRRRLDRRDVMSSAMNWPDYRVRI